MTVADIVYTLLRESPQVMNVIVGDGAIAKDVWIHSDVYKIKRNKLKVAQMHGVRDFCQGGTDKAELEKELEELKESRNEGQSMDSSRQTSFNIRERLCFVFVADASKWMAIGFVPL